MCRVVWVICNADNTRDVQDPFDAVEEKYREPVPNDLTKKVQLGLLHMNLDSFLPSLHECILFKMAAKQDTSLEDYIDNVDHPYVLFLSLQFIPAKQFSCEYFEVTCSQTTSVTDNAVIFCINLKFDAFVCMSTLYVYTIIISELRSQI